MTAHDLGDVAVDQGDAERAGAFYRKSLTAAIEIGNQHGHYMCTAGLACVAALNGDVREAGRRWGAVEAAEKHLDNPMHGRERKRYLRILGPLSNDPRFQAGQKAGRDLPLDQAGHDLMTA